MHVVLNVQINVLFSYPTPLLQCQPFFSNLPSIHFLVGPKSFPSRFSLLLYKYITKVCPSIIMNIMQEGHHHQQLIINEYIYLWILNLCSSEWSKSEYNLQMIFCGGSQLILTHSWVCGYWLIISFLSLSLNIYSSSQKFHNLSLH